MVVGVYSILEFFGAGQAPDLERIQKARKVRARAKSVYSKIQGSSRLLVRDVYKILEKTGPRAKSVYSKIQSPGRLLVPSVYKILEKLGQDKICILKNSEPRQIPGR